MPVLRLRLDVGTMLNVFIPPTLEVGPTWASLDHSGAITDRISPCTGLPCPFLEQDSEVRVTVAVFSPADVRRIVVARALSEMNQCPGEDGISPRELVYGEPLAATSPRAAEAPIPSAVPAIGDASHLHPDEISPGASEEWGSLVSRPITWGRPNPPPHPDEGIEWSNIGARHARAEWDNRRGSGSPPPRPMVQDLFSDRGDGFPLLHLRRTGENAESRTIDPVYVSSRSKRELRESRKAPFSSSPEPGEESSSTELMNHLTDRYTPTSPPPTRITPDGGERSQSRSNQHQPEVFDDDLDAILEKQRLADLLEPEREMSTFPSKRKREVLSDQEYRLRAERTDGLVEGLRRVRERSRSPESSGIEEFRRYVDKEEKAGAEGETLRGKDERLPDVSDGGNKTVPDDFDPPPSICDDNKSDSDDSDDDGVGHLARGELELDFSFLGIKEEDRGARKVTRTILTIRQLRRIMAAKESLFKFGTFIPRSEREADLSPEAPRWRAGRDLEWLRLRGQGTFERNWTWKRIQKEFATYKKTDIGFLFYVYDYKFSGEHRVRLVFDGSRRSADTYDETYAPTAR
jgi:hypothetical protein